MTLAFVVVFGIGWLFWNIGFATGAWWAARRQLPPDLHTPEDDRPLLVLPLGHRPGRPARAFTALNPDAPWELEHGYIAADDLAWREEFDASARAAIDEVLGWTHNAGRTR